MNTRILPAKRREGEKASALRRDGDIPAVVYGHGIATEHIALPVRTFSKIYTDAGESTLLDLVVDESEPRKVLVHDVARDPMSGGFLHVDLYQVNMKERMKARIHLRFTGVSPAVKERGGILVKTLTTVNIECLPEHLVQDIAVDLSPLKEFGQTVYLRDLSFPEGITLLDHADEAVVTVMKPKTEEEIAAELATETPTDVEQAVEVQKKGKEEELGEEGETAPTAEKKNEEKGKKEAKKEGKKEGKKE